jgi:serine-type D-Ala-D-Ala carboxypeptidase/endopeptidase (penicillin-binding protein 4)
MLKALIAVILYSYLVFPQTEYLQVQNRIGELLKDEFFASSSISLSIYDLTQDQIVFEIDSKKLLRPASNMKILTSAAGLLFLGEEYNFRTNLYYTGAIINQTLYGDLYIEGGCDPDFTSDDLDSLITALARNNIYDISGDIFIDLTMKDTLFWGNGWMWDDDPSTDAPYLSALNINDNAVMVLIKPGQPGNPAFIRTEPVTDYVTIINETITTNEFLPSAFITRDWVNRTNNIIARGKVAPADSEIAVLLNIFSPENYFMYLFYEKMEENGIRAGKVYLKSGVPDKAVNFYTFARSLDTVVVNLNKISDNLSAEMVLYALGEKYYGRPATARNGLRLIDSLIILAGHNPSDYVLADGSGVSHYNLISANLINDILKYYHNTEGNLFTKLYNSFPVAGVDGTLRNRMRRTSSENNVRAKTGTLSGVSSLSGYLTNKRGNTLSFSIIIQNYRGSSAYARYIQDVICNILSGT